MRILVVDDSDVMRKLIKSALNEMGHKDVLEAFNGSDALKVIEDGMKIQKEIGVVFFDLNMPGMGGLSFLKECQDRQYLGKMKFCVISSELTPEVVGEVLDFGVKDFIKKPVGPAELKAKMTKMLGAA